MALAAADKYKLNRMNAIAQQVQLGTIIEAAYTAASLTLAEGSVFVGDVSNAPVALDAKGNGKILVGNGTTITSVLMSADATMDNAGAVTIANGAVTVGKMANLARGSILVGTTANAVAALDAKTSGRILVGDGTDLVSVAVSGDVTLSSAGAVTIGANKVLRTMMQTVTRGSLLVGGTSNAVTTLANVTAGNIVVGDGTDVVSVAVSGDATLASSGALTIADGAVTVGKMANLARGSILVGTTANAVAALDAKTSGRILVGDGTDLVSVAVSGDATLSSSGALTIAANAVSLAKMATLSRGSIIVGGVSNACTALNAKSSGQILVGDGTDLVSVAVSGDVTLSSAGAVTIGAAKVLETMLAVPNVAGLYASRVARCVYNFATHGGTVGNIALSATIPIKAIITRVYYDIVTSCSSAGGAGTIAFKAQTDADLLAAVDADTLSGRVAGVPANTVGTMIKLTAARTIQAQIGVEDLTAGKIEVFIEYDIST